MLPKKGRLRGEKLRVLGPDGSWVVVSILTPEQSKLRLGSFGSVGILQTHAGAQPLLESVHPLRSCPFSFRVLEGFPTQRFTPLASFLFPHIFQANGLCYNLRLKYPGASDTRGQA